MYCPAEKEGRNTVEEKVEYASPEMEVIFIDIGDVVTASKEENEEDEWSNYH